MKTDYLDYKYCINLAINNTKQRIILLEKRDQKFIIEKYKDWLKDNVDYHAILLLREDLII